MKLIQIAALGKHNQLGLNGDMPWKDSMKQDLKFFRNQTKGHPIVMGRKTWQSLPGMLPGRRHIVISQNGCDLPEGVDHYPSISEFLEAWKEYDGDVYVIGGGSIYKAMLPFSSKLVLTRFDADFDADVYYPDLNLEDFDIQPLDDPYVENGILCQHMEYSRKSDLT